MKKLLSILAVAAIANIASAQYLQHPTTPHLNSDPASDAVLDKNKSGSADALDISEWYNHARAFDQIIAGSTVAYSVRFLSYDTNAYWTFHDDTRAHVFTHVMGQTFDPKDDTYDGISTVLSSHTDYMVDSIQFLRYYVRNLDSTMVGGSMVEVVDTMVIQFFTTPNNGIRFSGLQLQTGQNLLATPNRDNFSPTTMINSSNVKTLKIPLRSEDGDSVNYAGSQTSFFSTPVELPVGIQVNATSTSEVANVFAYTVHFKQMVPVKLGDTIFSISQANPNPGQPNNVLGVRTGRAPGVTQENSTNQKINNSIVMPTDLRWGATNSGNWKSYIAGNAYNEALLWDNWIKISSTNVSTDKINGLGEMKVYPNPSNSNTDANVTFASTKAGSAVITITDINGRVASSLNAEVTTGNNSIVVPTANLTAGIYFVNVAANGAKASTKLMIAK